MLFADICFALNSVYKVQRDCHSDSPFAREKVYEEMQDKPLSLKSSLAFGYILSPLQKEVCRNMNSRKIYF